MSELVRTPETIEEFELVDSLDEQQIVKSVTGSDIIEVMVYSFKSGSEEVFDLSWVAVKFIAQLYGNVSTKMEHEPIIDDGVIFSTYSCTDYARKVTMSGGAQQSLTENGKPDKFALAKATSKAQRNAIKNTLLQFPLWQAILTHYKQHRDLQEADMIRILISDNIEKFGYSPPKFTAYCQETYGKDNTDNMDLNELRQLSRKFQTSEGKKLFSNAQDKVNKTFNNKTTK